MSFRVGATIAVLILSQKSFSSIEFTLNPQVEAIEGSSRTQALRGIFDGRIFSKIRNASVGFEGFAIADGADRAPDQRRDRNVGYIQEAYLEFKSKSWSTRAGKFPLRWSESWALPSLDIWTARRWNQLFFLPLNYQLVNPTGVLLSYDTSKTSVNYFVNLQPAQDQFPEGIPAPVRTETQEHGIKIKKRLGGFDLTGVAAQLRDKNAFGGIASYAFDYFVPKIEGGGDGNQDWFFTSGVDIFVGDFTILPQFTFFSTKFMREYYQRLVYFPIKFTHDPHTIDLQAYGNLDSEDQLYSASYTYSFRFGLQAAAYVQNYWGLTGTLFGLYSKITGGNVYGMRLSFPFSL